MTWMVFDEDQGDSSSQWNSQGTPGENQEGGVRSKAERFKAARKILIERIEDIITNPRFGIKYRRYVESDLPSKIRNGIHQLPHLSAFVDAMAAATQDVRMPYDEVEVFQRKMLKW
jgi:hypothetical protein